ncbi:DUF29 domain-containing protein [Nostoc sp. CHAB 5715]|nr:DUF29 domain-containing protein [Nostoc sp. CHAB 5715]
MSDVADYDADILLWSERQAAILRDLKARVRGLPNELDLENVAEEIESVGRSELAAVESLVLQILIHAIKATSNTRPDLVAKWGTEASAFNLAASRRVTPAIAGRLDMDDLWQDALRQAALELSRFDERLIEGLPAAAPVDAAPLLAKPLDFGSLVGRIVRAVSVQDRAEP